MHLTDLLAPVAGRWLRQAQSDLDLVPNPVDTPRQTVAGPDADRVLLLGNGPVIGFGVRSHELALPGQLASSLHARTGRGAVVDVCARRGVRVGEGLDLARRTRLPTYDAVIVAIGATDASSLAGVSRWRQDLERLLDGLQLAAAPLTAFVVLPVSPVQRTSVSVGRSRRIIDAHSERLDRVVAEVCESRHEFDRLPAVEGRGAPRSPADYADLAERVVALLAPRLDLLAVAPSNAGARVQRRGPDPEVLRQAALERSGLIGSGTNVVLDRLLRSARDLFGASSAAVTLIDGDRVLFKASSGMHVTEVARAVAPCNRAIRQGGALIIPDLIGEPIAAHGSRFYAGFPLESPDGFRIGTLCILDDAPKPAHDVDEGALIELASRVEAELWREIELGEHYDAVDGLTDTGSLRLPLAVRAPVGTRD